MSEAVLLDEQTAVVAYERGPVQISCIALTKVNILVIALSLLINPTIGSRNRLESTCNIVVILLCMNIVLEEHHP